MFLSANRLIKIHLMVEIMKEFVTSESNRKKKLNSAHLHPLFDDPFKVMPPFEVLLPIEMMAGGPQMLPVVFSSPHSGRNYPQSFLDNSRLDELTLRRSEDCYVDLLFERVLDLGAPLLLAHAPRAYVDVNREPYELDPRMFDGRLPAYANTRSMRVAGGLGTIARIVGEGQDIYRGRISVEDAMQRIETIHRPYHRALKELLLRTVQGFGRALLVDCHSMPSASLGPLTGGAQDQARADIVLGDRYGTSCSAQVMSAFQHAFESAGFRVVRNRPYAGGYITEHYGHPRSGIHAIQIEINRAIYADEQTVLPLASFEDSRARIMVAVTMACDEFSNGFGGGYALAAE
jgi:N-formylglutamate amidohydrolase